MPPLELRSIGRAVFNVFQLLSMVFGWQSHDGRIAVRSRFTCDRTLALRCHLSFGELSEAIAPFARFFVPGQFRQRLGKSLASWQQYVEAGLQPTSHGILDLFCMSVTCVPGVGDGFRLLLPVRVLAGKTAGYIGAAVCSAAGGLLSLSSIEQLAKSRKLVILYDVTDAASTNRKFLGALSTKLPQNVLHFSHKCGIHQAFRCIAAILERSGSIDRLFCMSNVLHLTSKQLKLAAAVASIVRSDLAAGYVLAQPPPEDAPDRVHARAVCALLKRVQRGSSATAGLIWESRGSKLCDLLQGPWQQPRLLHYCSGARCACGGSLESCMTSVTDILVWLLLHARPDTPTFSRWTSLGPFIAWCALVCLLHRILPRSWQKAFASSSKDDADDVTDVDPDLVDFTKQAGRRVKKVTEWLHAPGNVDHIILLGITACPADDFTLQLIHLDEQGRILRDITAQQTSPAVAVQRDLAATLTEGSGGDLVLRTQFNDLPAASQQALLTLRRATALEMSASLWFRCNVYFQWPF